MKIEIKSFLTGSILFEGDFSCLSEAVTAAVKARAYLSGFAQIAFKGHGECGRMLTAIRQVADGPVLFQCGCFLGSEPELRAFIAGDEPEMVRSRILALDTVLVLLNS